MLVVASVAKILGKMRNNPCDWRIEDLQAIARHFGIEYSQHRTSHCTFRHSMAGKLTVPARLPLKPVYVRQFVELIERLTRNEQEV